MAASNLKNIDLNTDEINSKIFDFVDKSLYNLPVVRKINSHDDIHKITNSEYIAQPIYNGVRVFIVFYQINGIYYSVDFKKSNYKSNKMFGLEITAGTELYKGTILEGILYVVDNVVNIIVDDIHMDQGVDAKRRSKYERFITMNDMIKFGIVNNKNIRMMVSRFYRKTEHDFESLFGLIKDTPSVNSIAFCPVINDKHHTIYLYDIQERDIIDEVVVTQTFYMEKTGTEDVYQLYTYPTIRKMGIAKIPDISTTKQCNAWTKGKNKIILVKCRLQSNLGHVEEWIPQELLSRDVNISIHDAK